MEQIQNKTTQIYKNFCNYMQEDTMGVKMAIYSTAGIMFVYAYYRIRPITKFGKASDIPKLFIREKQIQYGTVKSIDAGHKSGPALLVDHKAPLNFLFLFSKKLLPVHPIGVTANANGCAWLQTVAVGQKIEFLPVGASKGGAAECQVVMLCPNYRKEKVDISKSLLELGFGRYEEPSRKLLKDPFWKKYNKYLTSSEKSAKNERLGVWSSSLPPQPWIIRKSKQLSKSLMLQILPPQFKLPELVR